MRGVGSLLALVLLIAAGPARGIELPHESAVPGGVKLLRLEAAGDAPRVEADGHRALVVRDGAAWVAVVGIPLAPRWATCGSRWSMRPAPHTVDFPVADKRYVKQSLKVAPGQVNLSPGDLARVNREHALLDHALSHWSEAPPMSLRWRTARAGCALELIRHAADLQRRVAQSA